MKWTSVITTWLNMLSKSALVLLSPLVLTLDSNEQKEIWFLLLSLNSLILMLDLGMLGNVTRWVALMSNKNGVNGVGIFVNKIYSPLYKIALFISLIFSVAYFYVYRGLNGLDVFLIITSSLFIPVSLKNNARIALLQGFHLVSKVQFSLSVNNLLFLLFTSIVLVLFKNIFIAFLVLNISHIVNAVVLRKIQVNFEKTENEHLEEDILPEQLEHLYKSSKRTVSGLIATTMFFNLIPFVFVEIESGALVVNVLFTLQVLKAISAFSQAPLSAKMPHFSQIYVTRNWNKLNREIIYYYYVSLIVFVLGASTIFFLSHLRVFDLDSKIELSYFPLMAIALGAERMLNSLLHALTVYKLVIWQWINPLLVILVGLNWFVIKSLEGYFIALLGVYIIVGLPLVAIVGSSVSKMVVRRISATFIFPIIIFVYYVVESI